MIYGYTRVSTKNQERDGNSLQAQADEILQRYPDTIIFKDTYTGTTTDRPEFNRIMDAIGEGDMLVVTKLDRLARNTREGIDIVQELFKRKASVHVLNVGLLEDTTMGKFFLTTMLAVAELERNLIVERTQSGKAVAKGKPGFKDGRPAKYNEAQLQHAVELLGEHSYSEVSKMMGISKSTLVRARRKFD